MKINQKEINSKGVKFFIEKDGKEIGRAFLYLMNNDLHEAPFGFVEDVFVQEEYRGQGLGKKLVTALIEEARKQKCYKLIATSRYAREKVHTLYKNIGFTDWGREFRINF